MDGFGNVSQSEKPEQPENIEPIRSFGRRRGHKLRPRRQELIRSLLPLLRVDPPPDGSMLNPAKLFSKSIDDLWLEVGFGVGEHLAAQAKANPRVGMIGCEPFINGVAALLDRISKENLVNICIFDDDARKLLECLPAESLGRVYVLFSDPWPKRRHHKRRFIGPAALDVFARLLKDGAEVRFASDHMGYVRWTLEKMLGHPDFVWQAHTPADWRDRPGDWVETRYEKKALESGRSCVYLTFRRRPRG